MVVITTSVDYGRHKRLTSQGDVKQLNVSSFQIRDDFIDF